MRPVKHPRVRLGQWSARCREQRLLLGGYASAEYRAAKNARTGLALSHPIFFFWWQKPLWFKFFSEVDRASMSGDHRQSSLGERSTLSGASVSRELQRLADLPLGQVSYPIGRWNLIQATHCWTTSRPSPHKSLSGNRTARWCWGIFVFGRPLDTAFTCRQTGICAKTLTEANFTKGHRILFNVP